MTRTRTQDIPVDGDRLWADLEANAAFGDVDATEGRGRTVLAGTTANRLARDRLVERLEAAGCTVRVDRVGNVVGRWTPPTADPDAAPVATGSHLDSVPEGGIFDGPLGVYAGLEAVRALRTATADGELAFDRPVEVVSFTEEEGARFGPGLLGSAVACGVTDPEAALALTDGEETLGDALAAIGYAGEGRLDAAGWDAFLELHVEQSRRLERADRPVGVVTDITGIAHLGVTVEGTADHAGATPMSERTDALAAAAEVVTAVERAAREAPTETAVGTVGSATVEPNATNVVPGTVRLGVDIRDVDRDAMDAVLAGLETALDRVERERGVRTTVETDADVDPAPMARRVRAACHRAATEAPDMHSGAAHDAMRVARVTDAGMLFARSRDGVSHNPREWTSRADCTAATRVLAGALAELAGAGGQR